MSKTNDQLNTLLSQFMDETQARDFRNDLSAADTLYEDHPVAHVRPDVLSDILKKVQRKLKLRIFWKMAEWSSVAAAVVIGTLLAGLYLLNTPKATVQHSSNTPIAKAASSHIWSDTPFAVTMKADPIEQELDEISETFRSVDLETYESPDAMKIDLMEIEEMELIADNTSFWKGY